jgi:hypothetical protein
VREIVREPDMTRQGERVPERAQDDSGLASEICSRVSRKVFLRASLETGTTYVSGRAIEAVLPSVWAEGVRQRCGEIAAHQQALLERLFFVGGNNNYTSVLPADDHPGGRLRRWQCFYELEMDAAQTYASRFFGDTRFCPVKEFPEVQPGDDVVIIGSQVANSSARALLGGTRRRDPAFLIAHSGWRTELHWNLVTPENAPSTTITDFRGRRKSLAHAIYERGRAQPYESLIHPAEGRYLDDYLLVTALPVHREGKPRVLVLSGLHGAGSRAVDLILREPPTALLESAAHQLADAEHFQLLIHVETAPNRRGELMPFHPELVEARVLIVD